MAIFEVTTLVDEDDGGSGGTGLSLREALVLANNAAGPDTITFAAGLSGGTLVLTSGQHLTIAGDVVIDGDLNNNGTPDITIDGNDTTRLFFVDSGTVTLNGLALVNGRSQGGNGGGEFRGGGGGLGAGGAVFVDSGVNLRLEDVTFGVGSNNGNLARGGDGGNRSGGSSVYAGGGGGGGLGGFGNPNGGTARNSAYGVNQPDGAAGGGTTGGAGGARGGFTAHGSAGGPGGFGGGGGGGGAANFAGGNFQQGGAGGAGGFGGGGGGGGTNSASMGGGLGGVGGFGGGGGAGGPAYPNPPGVNAGGFGGGNSWSYWGGGGAGMGGDVFVMNGASVTVAGNVTFANGQVQGGDGSAYAGDGAGFGSGIFLVTNGGAAPTLTFDPSTGNTQTIGDAIADQTGSGGSGADAGSVGIVKNGLGTLVLSGANTFTGATTINAGTLQVDGSIANSAVTVKGGATLTGTGTFGNATIESGGTLKGTGSFVDVTVQNGGSLTPGASLGTIDADDLTLNAGANFVIDIGGKTSGQFDQVAALGTVSLAGAQLSVSFIDTFVANYEPGSFDYFVIIDNAGTDPIVGTFAGLSEGTIFSVDGVPLLITYAGGDGNDVALLRPDVQTIVVTTLNDELDAGVNPDDMSLREAIRFATDHGISNITFANSLASKTIVLTQGQLLINSNLKIDGDINHDGTPDITIDGNDATRQFFIDSGDVTLQGLALVNGRSQGGAGGAGVSGGGGGLGGGGAIFVNSGANLRVEDVTFGAGANAGNEARGGSGAMSIFDIFIAHGGGGGGGLGSFADGGEATGAPGARGGGTNGGSGGAAGAVAGSGNAGGFGGGGGGGGDASGDVFSTIPNGVGGSGGTGGFGGGGGGAGFGLGQSGQGGNGGFGGGGGGPRAGGGAAGFGGGNGGAVILNTFGGGGAGLGGSVLVMDGASITIAGNGTITNGLAQGGLGGNPDATSDDGSGFGSGIFLVTNGGIAPTLTFDPGSGDIQAINDGIADQTGSGGSGSVGIVKNGAGMLILAGDNTFSGGTTVNDGTLQVDRSVGNVTVDAGGTLTGDGTVGAVTINGGTLSGTLTVGTLTFDGGTLSPGNSPGISTSGNLSFMSATDVDIELGGTDAAPEFDQHIVNGTVNLTNATLNVTFIDDFVTAPATYEPGVHDRFQIITNDSNDAITGTFTHLGSPLAEGAVFTMDGVPLFISYKGGDGNDVVLAEATETFEVTTLADELDARDTNLATVDFSDLSLREALALANGLPGDATITFAANLTGGALYLANGAGDLDITSNVTINGDIDGDGDADITIDADSGIGQNDATSRVFNISNGESGTYFSATLNGLVIRDGVEGAPLGAMYAGQGGGIVLGSYASLTLTNSTVSDNTATFGGGIGGSGRDTKIINSTLSGNSAQSAGGITAILGLTMTNSTVWGNNSADSFGGIVVEGTVKITNSTVSGNSGGGIRTLTSTHFTLTNSIVAGNHGAFGDDIFGSGPVRFYTGGNIIGDTFTVDGGSPQTSIALTDVFASVVKINPDGIPGNGDEFDAGALADNGGRVQTVALKASAANPAIDRGTGALPTEQSLGVDVDGDGTIEATPISVDARGFARNVDFGNAGANEPDLGAFEAQNVRHFNLLWHNTTTDELRDWTFTNGAVTNNSIIAPPVTAWQVAAIGNFNADGIADIVWHNDSTGDTRVWLMNASGQLASSIPQGSAPTNWEVAATGDFNGDGMADLLWQNTANGAARVWLMENGVRTSQIAFSGPSADWFVTGVGDFNGDGTDDILWRNTSNGQLREWTMANGTFSAVSVLAGTLPADNKVAATGDFNGDGADDIIFHNTTSGAITEWLMANAAIASTQSLGNLASDWKLSGAGDYNQDGADDLIWHNSSTGQVVEWVMAAGAHSSTTALGTTPLDWQVSVNPATHADLLPLA